MSEMNRDWNPALDGDRRPAGYVRLPRRGPAPRAQAGCALTLALVLLAVGVGVLALYLHNPAGKGDMWVMPVVGGAFALVGAVLLAAGVMGLRGASVLPPEVFLEEPGELTAGRCSRLRLRQPGPARLDTLTVTLLGERVYRRRVRPSSTSTVEDQERLHEQRLCLVERQRLGRLEALERELEVVPPADAVPSGPAPSEGTIRWTIEVRGDAGFLRTTYHPFEVAMRGAAGRR